MTIAYDENENYGLKERQPTPSVGLCVICKEDAPLPDEEICAGCLAELQIDIENDAA